MIEEHEKLTMSQRIDAFYRQSGGPGNPEIARILEEHLINGKDHGARGKKEEMKDVFTEVFLGDHSTQPLVLWMMRMRYSIKEQWEAFLNSRSPDIDVDKIIEELKKHQTGKS